MNATKKCRKCQNVKSTDDFYRHKSGALRAVCKPCMKAASSLQGKGRYQRDPKASQARYKRWAKKHPDKVRAYARRGQRQHRQRKRDVGQTFLPIEIPQ